MLRPYIGIRKTNEGASCALILYRLCWMTLLLKKFQKSGRAAHRNDVPVCDS